MATTEPQKWTATLGSTADVNAIPGTTPSGSGRASFSGLFPPVTQLPLDQGGIAPERGDFNALFKYLGEYLFYLMQGGTFSYSTDYDYTAGNLVMHGGSLYLCIAANGPGSAVKYPTDMAYWRKLALISDMPTVGNGVLTIQNNGATVATFSANQAGNTTANISVPTVNNGTLTIQQDGVTVGTFTANQSGNTTVNVTSGGSGPQIFFADANSAQDAAIRAAGFWRCGRGYTFWTATGTVPSGGRWYICYAPNGHTITEVDLRWSYTQYVVNSANGSEPARAQCIAWIAPPWNGGGSPQRGVDIPTVGMTSASEVAFPANPYVPN